MSTPFQPEIMIESLSPDAKSYVYQILNDFSLFTTPETVSTVTAKDPMDLWKKRSQMGEEFPKTRTELKQMYRIEIALSEGGSTLSAEGLHGNLYEAIRIARDRLLKILDEIQDDVVSNQDRHQQIQQALASGGSVH
jgi:ribosome-associated translation inhibitor RaiA